MSQTLLIASRMLAYPLNWKLVTEIVRISQRTVWIIDCGDEPITDVHRMHGTIGKEEVQQFSASNASRLLLSRMDNLNWSKLLRLLMQQNDVALLYVGEPTENAFLLLAACFIASGQRNVWTTVCENEFKFRLSQRRTFKSFAKKLALRLILQRVKGVFATSRQSFKSLVDVGLRSDAYCVTPFGCSRDFGKLVKGKNYLEREMFVAGIVGRIVKEKGIFIAIDALKNTPQVYLEVAGEGGDKDRFLRYADDAKIRARITCCGMLNEQQLAEFYQRIDCLICVSLSTEGWREQFGLAVVEAMSAGVPVIVSTSGSLPEVVGDAGIVVKEADVDGLREAVDKLRADPSLRRDMARLGQDRFHRYFRDGVGAEQIVSSMESLG